MIQLNVVLTVIIILFIEISMNINEVNADPQHELLMDIVSRYRVAARNLRDSQAILPFEVQFPIHDIIQVDGTINEYRIRATIKIKYQFESFHWNTTDTQYRFHDLDEIYLTKTIIKSLWLPDIQLLNEDITSLNIEHESAKITRDGSITWIRRGLFTILSPIDLTYYPFDRQHLRIPLFNKQKLIQLKYQTNQADNNHSPLPRSLTIFSKIFSLTNMYFSENNSSILQQYNQTLEPMLLRGWFVRTLIIEPSKAQNESSENIVVHILLQRRRESHIYTTILPTLFFSAFIFIFYCSPIESYQRLTISVLHVLATLIFIVHLDRKISAEQLSYTPFIIRYLSVIFLIEILSLFFDHIIHSIYYGGLHFISNWLRKDEEYETQPARLSHVKLLSPGLHSSHMENYSGHDVLVKQLIERQESMKNEDCQNYRWHKQARLSECLCCWFFLFLIIIVFIIMFFILPTLGLTKMT